MMRLTVEHAQTPFCFPQTHTRGDAEAVGAQENTRRGAQLRNHCSAGILRPSCASRRSRTAPWGGLTLLMGPGICSDSNSVGRSRVAAGRGGACLVLARIAWRRLEGGRQREGVAHWPAATIAWRSCAGTEGVGKRAVGCVAGASTEGARQEGCQTGGQRVGGRRCLSAADVEVSA